MNNTKQLHKLYRNALLSSLVCVFSFVASSTVLAQPITYQGFLRDRGLPATGEYDFRFRLFNAATGGIQIGSDVIADNLNVRNGFYTLDLNFPNAWDGSERWLEIAVRPGTSTGSYTTLSPRVRVMPNAYAYYSYRTPWSGLIGIPEGFADGIDNDTTYTAGAGLLLSGTTFSIASGGVVTDMLANSAITTIKIADGAVTTAKLADNAVTSAKIADGTIVAADLANGAVTNAKLADGAVGTSKIADGAVTDPKIASVSWSKITGAPNFLTGVSTQNPLLGDGSSSSPLRLQPGTAAGQILWWNGSAWEIVSGYTAGTGLLLSGRNFSLDTGFADNRYVNEGQVSSITNSMLVDGAVTDSKLSTTGVSAGTYGNSTQVPQFTVNAQGRITGVTNVTISGVSPGGSAGGDLSGNYPNPTVARIQGRSVSSAAPANGQVLKWNASSNRWEPANDSGDSFWQSVAAGIFYNAGNVGIGDTSETLSRLLVQHNNGTTLNRATLRLHESSNEFARIDLTNGASTTLRWRIAGKIGGDRDNDHLMFWHSTADAVLNLRGNGRVGIRIPFPEDDLHVAGNIRFDGGYLRSWGAIQLQPDVDGTGDDAIIFRDNTGNVTLLVNESGNVGIGTTNPEVRLQVAGAVRAEDAISARRATLIHDSGPATGATLTLVETVPNDYARIELTNFNALRQWHIAGMISDSIEQDRLNLWHNVSGDILSLSGRGTVNVGLPYLDTARLNVAADSTTDNPTLRLHETAADFARLEFTNTNGARKWQIAGLISSNPASDYLNFWNSATGNILSLRGDGTVSVRVLEITGADLAEKFPTTDEVEPGMVVEIDPENPGNLRKARGAYNKRVVGVVAGANGLSKGIVLGNLEGSENHTPIAMSGRVWVYADATERAIEPGDFLTTAERPGYAMKADDLTKAQGAIIGKAMTRLEKGKTGMVLVVVNLQ